ncbi:MAG: hypothetical protein U5L10_01090 [Candidatus Moranbacteria bacterium]|nr:hypothetical protein [Candidatus Moranbacteria bacterium]
MRKFKKIIKALLMIFLFLGGLFCLNMPALKYVIIGESILISSFVIIRDIAFIILFLFFFYNSYPLFIKKTLLILTPLVTTSMIILTLFMFFKYSNVSSDGWKYAQFHLSPLFVKDFTEFPSMVCNSQDGYLRSRTNMENPGIVVKCFLPLTDYGQSCITSSQCQGKCLIKEEKECKNNCVGYCSKYDLTCFPGNPMVIMDGEVFSSIFLCSMP